MAVSAIPTPAQLTAVRAYLVSRAIDLKAHPKPVIPVDALGLPLKPGAAPAPTPAAHS